MTRLVSVIVPAYNAEEVLAFQLEALSQQTYTGTFEVIVADNGSTDNTARVVLHWQKRMPYLRLADASRRAGASGARNIGAEHARGELFAFCDADDVAEPDWLRALTIAAGSCDIVGGSLDVQTLNESPLRMAAAFHLGDELARALDFLPYVFSGNCAIHGDAFRRLGGWNTSYRHVEDVELSWRAQFAGFQVGYAPDAVMRYRVKRDDRSVARQLYRFGRAHPQLYRDFRTYGMPRSSVRTALKTWAWASSRVPSLSLADPELRWSWRRAVALRAGRVVGSAAHRVLYL
jgi:glycosyltransferase involved in cell wall biosynthesis